MHIGEIYISNEGHIGELVTYRTAKDVDVLIDGKFLREHIQYGNFKRGRFGSREAPRICGVGYIGEGEYKSKDEYGKHTDAYRKWHDMLERCYRSQSLKKRPTYKNITVCEEWLNFQNFAKWYYENLPDIDEPIEIDKDILGGEQYSPETCCLIPRRLNIMFSKKPKLYKDIDLPIGVFRSKHSKYPYGAHLYKNGETICKICFNTPDEAFDWYAKEKKKYILEITNQYKDALPQKVYDAIKNYELKPYPYENC